MRRATWGWLVALLVLQLCLQGCGLLDGPVSTPGVTREAPQDTSQPTVITETPANATPGSLFSAGQRPPKPQAGVPTEAQDGAIATAEPLPTADPNKDDWTVLVYMSAANGLDAAALQSLNEMEVGGESEQVNVLVQLDRIPVAENSEDWGGARRYRIIADDDLTTINSELVEEPGPTNMGDPDSLSDFVVWGIQNFPANRYALVLWGSGSGWRGLALDSTEEDDLSMSDLTGALQRALSQARRPRLDLVGFDAGLMAQLEVLNAIQPFADYAVAAPGLLPLTGWDYEALLAALYDDTGVNAEQFATLIATTALEESARLSPIPPMMTAVDLRTLPRVNAAVEQLSQMIVQNAALSAGAIADARRLGQIATLDHDGNDDLFGAVDVGDFAAELAQYVALPELARRSEAVVDALTTAIVSRGRPAADAAPAPETDGGVGGVTLAFLPVEHLDDPAYDAVAPPSWQQALHAFYDASAQQFPPPQGQVAVQGSGSAGAQQPVLLGLELRAANVDGAALIALRQESDGRQRLMYRDTLGPAASPNAAADAWPDGVNQREYIWDTTAHYIGDGANGDFAPLWPLQSNPRLFSVPALYLPAQEGAESREAALFFDAVSGQLQSVWQTGSNANAPLQVLPSAGDSFQLYSVYLTDENELAYEPGVTLVYSDGVQISFDRFPLPSGNYQIGLVAGAMGSSQLAAATDVTISNDDLTPGYQAYLNADYGFQFLYPQGWPEPVFDGRRMATAGSQRGPALAVSVYPEIGSATAAQLKSQTLESFGEIDVLHEEEVTVGGEAGLLTAYGYNGDDGPHTGIFVAFVNTARSVGYIFDVDGLALDEAMTIEIADHLVQSWRFPPVSSGSWPDQWLPTSLGLLTITLPAAYGHETLDNDWELFKDGTNFLAVRTDEITGEGRAAIAGHWAEVASRGVEAFVSAEPEPFALAGTIWSRVEFSYEDEEGPVSGFILATIYGGEEVVAWAETPAEIFDQLVTEQYLVAVAGALPQTPTNGAVLYETTFDQPGAWGVGQQEGATGTIEQGTYRLAVNAPRGFFWTTAGVSLIDGQFEVDLAQTAGAVHSGHGMLLRANSQDAGSTDARAQTFYVFEISTDGYVWIGWCKNSCSEATTLVGEGWFASDAVNKGLNATNNLRVEAHGPRMTFFVNGVEVGQIEDGATIAGDAGLFVETLGEGEVVVEFDEFRVTAR